MTTNWLYDCNGQVESYPLYNDNIHDLTLNAYKLYINKMLYLLQQLKSKTVQHEDELLESLYKKKIVC